MKKANTSLYRLALLVLVIFTPFLCGCISESESSESLPDEMPSMADSIHAGPADQLPGTDTEQVALQNNLFALDMYQELAAGDENIFFSPWSLNSALSMTYEGARGQTAEEMKTVLHLPENESNRRRTFSLFDQRINAPNSNYTLSTANALWVDDHFTLKDEYQDLVEETYHARTMNLDFRERSEEARKVINAWVAEKTLQKIEELIPTGYVDSSTVLVLTNAIYFKGTWVSEFDLGQTREEDFYTKDGRTVAVPMMRKLDDDTRFSYLETEDIQILEMPYQGENISLMILLPKKNDLDSLERSISSERLAQWRGMLEQKRVNIYIPKFKVEAKYLLGRNLINMGMPSAFGLADFSGMTARGGIFISEVIHQAYVDVNEEGTEAAAATAVVIRKGGLEEKIPVFRADHPFLFMITDEETGLILFMGRLSDPKQG